MKEKKIWLITGVSSGFGRDLAREVAVAGHTVIGTVRKQEQVQQVDALMPGRTHGAILDVNDHVSARALLAKVAEEHGRIDVLVNNAGYGITGAIEETSMDEARAQFETNFFGVLNLTQAVLPFMRKQGSGHILQISSQGGVTSTPGLGVYCASKHALEAVSEALFAEVKHMGIRVTLIEPGPFRTEWAGPNMLNTAAIMHEYASSSGVMRERLGKVSGNQPGDPVRAAKAMIAVTEHPEPPLRLPLGAIALATIRKKLAHVTSEIETWEKTALGADYPSAN